MDVWITYCRKECRCKHCPEKINTGEPKVVGKLWMKRREGQDIKVMNFPITMRWHPQCWIEQGLIELNKRPYEARGDRGRKSLVMSKEDKVTRNKLLRRRSSFFFRLRAAADAGETDKIIQIIGKMEMLAVEIEKYGGAPKSWKPE